MCAYACTHIVLTGIIHMCTWTHTCVHINLCVSIHKLKHKLTCVWVSALTRRDCVWSTISSDITNSSFASSLLVHYWLLAFINGGYEIWVCMSLYAPDFSMSIFYMNEEMQESTNDFTSSWLLSVLSTLPYLRSRGQMILNSTPTLIIEGLLFLAQALYLLQAST